MSRDPATYYHVNSNQRHNSVILVCEETLDDFYRVFGD